MLIFLLRCTLILSVLLSLSGCKNPIGGESTVDGNNNGGGNEENTPPAPPTIQGAVITGQILTVNSYGENTTVSDLHQWYSDGVEISGATGISFTVSPAEEGTDITLRVSESSDSNALSNWNPADMGSTLFVWYDPYETGGDLTAGWMDKSTQGNDGTVSNYGAPTTNANGKLQMTNSGYIIPSQFTRAQGYAFMTIYTQDVSDNNGRTYSSTSTNVLFGNWGERQGSIYLNGSPNAYNSGGIVANRDTATHLMSFQANDDGSYIYRYDDTEMTGSGYWAGNFYLCIGRCEDFGGAGYSDSEPSNFEAADFIGFNEEISNDDRDRIEGYLAHKWGLTDNLPVSHPYKVTAP